MPAGRGTQRAGSRAPLVKWVGALPAGLGGSSLEREGVSGFLFLTQRKEDEGWWAPREIGSDPIETSF